MANGNGNDSAARFDHIERVLAQIVDAHLEFEAEHKRLLVAQVVMTDTMQKLAEAQIHTDGKINALIAVVDDLVRNRPKGGQ